MAPELLEVLKLPTTDWRQDLQRAAVKFALEEDSTRCITVTLKDHVTGGTLYEIILAGDDYLGMGSQ